MALTRRFIGNTITNKKLPHHGIFTIFCKARTVRSKYILDELRIEQAIE